MFEYQAGVAYRLIFDSRKMSGYKNELHSFAKILDHQDELAKQSPFVNQHLYDEYLSRREGQLVPENLFELANESLNPMSFISVMRKSESHLLFSIWLYDSAFWEIGVTFLRELVAQGDVSTVTIEFPFWDIREHAEAKERIQEYGFKCALPVYWLELDFGQIEDQSFKIQIEELRKRTNAEVAIYERDFLSLRPSLPKDDEFLSNFDYALSSFNHDALTLFFLRDKQSVLGIGWTADAKKIVRHRYHGNPNWIEELSPSGALLMDAFILPAYRNRGLHRQLLAERIWQFSRYQKDAIFGLDTIHPSVMKNCKNLGFQSIQVSRCQHYYQKPTDLHGKK